MALRFRSLALAGLLTSASAIANAAWPDDHPIEVLVGFAAGGGTDIMVRNMVPFIQKKLGGKATLVIVNRPGAGSEISNTFLARAKPDGYTLGIVNVPALEFVPMYKKAAYDPARIDLVARVLSDPTVLVVRKDSARATLKDLMAALRAKPGSVSFGHNGIGTNGHLALLQLQNAGQSTFNEIPYNGTAQSKTALLGGHIDVAAMTSGELPDAMAPDSKFRLLAQLGATRLPTLNSVPTAVELGFDAVMPAERGLAAPVGVDPAILRRVQQAVEQTLKDPQYIAKASNDAPVLAFLPGAAWREEINVRKPGYERLARSMPKE